MGRRDWLPPLGAKGQGAEGGQSLWGAEKWMKLQNGAGLEQWSCPPLPNSCEPGDLFPKHPFLYAFLSLFLPLCPSTCYISLTHLSSITGGPTPSPSVSGLFLSPIPLIFLFPLCSTSADGNHSCQGYHMLMAQQVPPRTGRVLGPLL